MIFEVTTSLGHGMAPTSVKGLTTRVYGMSQLGKNRGLSGALKYVEQLLHIDPVNTL